jgi:branched-chain amino acid transport system substrate-binding protein
MFSAALSAQGTLGVNAKMMVMSAKAAVQQVNDAGGVLGHKIEVSVVDDQGVPTTAITKLQSAINSGHKPFAWFDSGPSNLSAAVLPVLNQNKILSFNQAPAPGSSDPAKFPLNFDIVPSSDNSAAAFCPFAKKSGYTKIAVLYADDAYGGPVSAAVKKDCESFGSTVTGVQKFADTALDVTPQLQSLRGGKPQALVLIGYGAPVGYVMKGLTTLGWNVPILGDIAVAATDLISHNPPAGLVGTSAVKNLEFEVFQSTVSGTSTEKPKYTDAMVSAIEKQGTIPASLILAYEYDAVQLFAAAATKANTVTDAGAIAKAMVGLGTGDVKTGVFSQYFFKSDDHSPNEPATAFTFAKPSTLTHGQFEPSGG